MSNVHKEFQDKILIFEPCCLLYWISTDPPLIAPSLYPTARIIDNQTIKKETF